LLRAVIDTWTTTTIDPNASNEEQIYFAKRVWNNCDVNDRHLLQPSTVDIFRGLSADNELTPLLEATLTRFLSLTKVGSGKRDDAIRIAAEVVELKRRKAEETPFSVPLTPGEERKIAKHDALMMSGGGVMYDSHLPNSNAVTYVWLMARAIDMMKIPKTTPTDDVFTMCEGMLKFVELHGDKTVVKFTGAVNKWPEIPYQTIDIKPSIQAMISNDDFVTASSEDIDNRLLKNTKLTLKRLYRMVHIFIPSNTHWGLLDQETRVMKRGLIELWTKEEALNAADSIAMSIVWYLSIRRKNISCVMVDHHESSGYAVLSGILGKAPVNQLECPDHVFDFDKHETETYDFDGGDGDDASGGGFDSTN
jgi:hypothetical protein